LSKNVEWRRDLPTATLSADKRSRRSAFCPIRVLAPAKLNLFLKVTGRRSDGYHELYSLMCCIELYDQLIIYPGAVCGGLKCDNQEIPCDNKNLAMRAVSVFNAALEGETTVAPLPVFVELTKVIPAGAGLGGGSSDAAAVLRVLNGYHGFPFSETRLAEIALGLGADVPFFISQVPAIATGIGEKLFPYRHLPSWHVLVVYPGFSTSTAEVFGSLNLRLTNHEKKLRYFAFKNGNLDVISHMCNDLEEAVIKRFPVIATIKAILIEQGALGSQMTGSGSCVFGLFSDAAGARQAARNIVPQPGWRVFVTRLLTHTES
jgi:4-diphosphocytidyl-2-C-methyl-D-erythritol kinase